MNELHYTLFAEADNCRHGSKTVRRFTAAKIDASGTGETAFNVTTLDQAMFGHRDGDSACTFQPQVKDIFIAVPKPIDGDLAAVNA